ncbi:MAG TPA: response regulator [Gemmatimonadales bacterium]|nr:response regulator [Gemmatimonadales bacterium]
MSTVVQLWVMADDLASRVLLVMPQQWHRSLLRAQLRELGYDALGAPDLEGALLYPITESERGPVGLILVDQQALVAGDHTLLKHLLERHGQPPSLLITPAGRRPAAGQWTQVVTRPVSIADLVAWVRRLLPRSPGPSGPIE